LSTKPGDWRAMFEAIDAAGSAPDGFMTHPRDETTERDNIL